MRHLKANIIKHWHYRKFPYKVVKCIQCPTEKPPTTTPDWKDFLCGWGAATANVIVTYPINRLVYRQILYGVSFYTAFLQIKNEGLVYFFRGMLPPLCQKTITLSLMFGVFAQVREPLVEHGVNPQLARVIGAFASGCTEAIAIPFERVQTLLSDAKYDRHYKNTFHAFKKVRVYGFGEYYRGYKAVLLRNGPSNVIFFVLRDKFCTEPGQGNGVFQGVSEFVCGGLIGCLNSLIFYPVNVSRVATQKTIGGKEENPFRVLLGVYRMRGRKIRNIYKGALMNCARSFVGWGVVNFTYQTCRVVMYGTK